jgi:hypothetical protein
VSVSQSGVGFVEGRVEGFGGVGLIAARAGGGRGRGVERLVGEEFVVAFGGGDGVGRGVVGNGHDE